MCHAIVFISSYKAYLDLLTLFLDRLLVLGLDILDTTDHVESGLGDRVVLSVKDLLESVQGLNVSDCNAISEDRAYVLEGYQTSLDTSEDLGDGEGLRHESLDDQPRSLFS